MAFSDVLQVGKPPILHHTILSSESDPCKGEAQERAVRAKLALRAWASRGDAAFDGFDLLWTISACQFVLSESPRMP